MGFFTILLIAIGLSADCFAVSIGAAISRSRLSLFQISRVAIFFGVFQALMALAGWAGGRVVVDYIAAYDHWIALVLLGGIGGKMVWESFKQANGGANDRSNISGWLLLTLSIATSIDSLAVGLTFAFMEINILVASLTIGIISLLVSLLGFAVGKRAGEMIGKRAELVGGLVLIGIGIKIVLEHTL